MPGLTYGRWICEMDLGKSHCVVPWSNPYRRWPPSPTSVSQPKTNRRNKSVDEQVGCITRFYEGKQTSQQEMRERWCDLEAHFHVMPSFDFSGSPSANDFAFGYKYCIQRWFLLQLNRKILLYIEMYPGHSQTCNFCSIISLPLKFRNTWGLSFSSEIQYP